MYWDALLQFSVAQVLRDVGTVDSDNILDFRRDSDPQPFPDMGVGSASTVLAQVVAPFASDGDATLAVKLWTAGQSDFSDAVLLLNPGAVPVASLTTGAVVFKARLPGRVSRFLKLTYTVAGAAFTAGSVTAGILENAIGQHDYPSGINVAGL